MSAAVELSRLFPVERARDGAHVVVEATEAECEALTRRMGVNAVKSLRCTFDLRAEEADTIAAQGLLTAEIVQNCVVTLEPFESVIEEEFRVRFVPEGEEIPDLDIEADDEIVYAGNQIDLGEAASEQLALALDPFPRKPDAVLPDGAGEQQTSPFAALAKFRDPPP